MIGCVICKRELQEGEHEDWETTYIGLVCPDHKKEEVELIIHMTISKVKSDVKASLESHIQRGVEQVFSLGGHDIVWPIIY